jgi:adenosyl cobinamide kinase/adenosyl cobinamide phosphate guanylyltransferase
MSGEPEKTTTPKARVLTVKNIYDKQYDTLKVSGIWAEVLGEVEANGAWLIYGKEKNGKTTAALMLAWHLSKSYRVLYISAEEGVGKAFRDTLQRIGVDAGARNIHFMDYEKVPLLKERLKRRKSAEVVLVDNLTIYNDELKGNALREFLRELRSKLIIFVAHEERGEPYTAAAKLARKLAKVIIHVKGLLCSVSGRVPGGTLIIDEVKAQLYHGYNIKNEGTTNKAKQEVLPAPEVKEALPGRSKKKANPRPNRGGGAK